MNIKVEFDYHYKIIYVPNGYIENVTKLQKMFLEWVAEQPECVVNDPSDAIALSYNEKDFLRFINDVILQRTTEKAYFVQKEKRANISMTIKF